MSKIKITDAHQEEMRKRYLAGERIADIARLFEVDGATVHLHLKKMGAWRRKEYQRRPCAVPGCSKPHTSQGYCHTHYMRLRNRGDLSRISDRPPVVRQPVVDCDHTTNKCSCANQGNDYKTYLQKAKLKKPNHKKWHFEKILRSEGWRGKVVDLVHGEEDADKRDGHEREHEAAHDPGHCS